MSFLEYNGLSALDNRIIKFINSHSRQYLDVIIGNDIIEEDRRIIKLLLDTVGIEDDIWKAILSDNKYNEIWADNIVDLREDQVRYLIDHKLLGFDSKLFSAIGAKFSWLYMNLLCKNPDEVSEHLHEFNFTTENLINIAKQPAFQSYNSIIYALITADKITDESIADNYLKYVANDASHLSFESLRKAADISHDDKLKMSAVSANMQQDFADNEHIATLLISIGEPFNQIVENQSEIFEQQKSPEACRFFEQLVARKFASHRDASKMQI